MKIFSALSVVLLLVFLSEIRTAMGAVRIPEHTCPKVVRVGRKCNAGKCMRRCSKYPFGDGRCIFATTCVCTFYCNQPPL